MVAISTPTSEQYRGDGIGLCFSLVHGYCKKHKNNVPLHYSASVKPLRSLKECDASQA